MYKRQRVKTSSFARHHVNVTMARAKVATTYANSILANLEATQDGYDEGLLLDTRVADLFAGRPDLTLADAARDLNMPAARLEGSYTRVRALISPFTGQVAPGNYPPWFFAKTKPANSSISPAPAAWCSWSATCSSTTRP